MLIFEKAIQNMSTRMSQLKVDKSRCTHNRSRLSKCSKCIDICPVDGIEIKNKNVIIKDNCIECGLCAGVCPTDSIRIQEPTEKNLYSYMEKQAKENEDIILTCNRNENTNNDSFKVACLGSLSLEFLIGLDILPVNANVLYKDENCMNCEVKRGIETYLENLKKMRAIKEILEIEVSSIVHMEKAPKKKRKKINRDQEVDEERRDFLSSIFKTTKNLPNIAIGQILGDGNKKEKSRAIVSNPIFKKYKILSDISKELREEGMMDRELIYYNKPYLKDNCKLCGACSLLCPMGALTMEETEDEKILMLNNELCSGCELCTEVCYHKSLGMENKNLYDFSNNDLFIIAKEEK